MKTIFLSLIFISVSLYLYAQVDMELQLQPYKIYGRENPLKHNISFAGYKTHNFHRNIASWFSFGNFSIANEILKIDGIPLYRKEKTRSVDIFSFALKTDSGIVSHTECRAVLRKNETFHLFKPKDSSFFKIKNVDYLEARIQTDKDTSHIWYIAAANLNGTIDGEQQGVIRCGDQEICFVKTTCLLRDEPVDKDDVKSLFTSLNIVYLFTYKEQHIAAVSFKLTDKKFWCRTDLDANIRTIVASTASLLCLRNDLYY
jgi:hypothetical protein